MNCPQCESILLTEVFQTSNAVRCAACGNVAILQGQSSTQANQYAWRSFWLGLTSIVLLGLTGIPAILYGVRSLLQMRFVRSQKNDRRAAVAGIALGVLFGFVGTAVVALVGGFALVFTLVIEETKEPERVLEILATIGSIEVPEGFHPVEARRFEGNFRRIDWRDGAKPESANGRIRLVKAVSEAQFGDMQIAKAKAEFDLHRDIEIEGSSRESETLSWKFANETRDVTRMTDVAVEGDFEVVHYFATNKPNEKQTENQKLEPREVIALAITIRKPGKYSEEDVKKVFESFEPKR